MTVRTRMAPSPTGEFHIGSMRTLLYNYALAYKDGGDFVLRIEDTDRERFVEGATERLMQVIYDYGLKWSEGPDVGGKYGPYVQSERLAIYKQHAQELVEHKHAYYCFCSKERLEELRSSQQALGVVATKYDKHCLSLSQDEITSNLKENKPYVIRLNVPSDQRVTFVDEVLGEISIPTNDIDDQVLLKSDGFPTYHLAVVVDDHLMQISHILRGAEWLPSTPKHILLYKAFGWELPKYAHLPLLKEKGETKKLSKRNGSVNANEFLVEGYLPEALLNFLMFLGWNPGTEKELYSLAEFVQDFSIDKVHTTDLVVFDREKLAWLNGVYIRSLTPADLLTRLLAWGEKTGTKVMRSESTPQDAAFDLKVVGLIQERLKVLSEYNSLVDYFYTAPAVDTSLLVAQSGTQDRALHILRAFATLFDKQTSWEKEHLDQVAHQLLEQEHFKPKEAFMTLRVAITGSTSTPPIFDILEVLGKSEVLVRIKTVMEML